MNAIELLENQHRQIEGLFARLSACGREVERRQACFVQLADLIDAHTEVEEQMFYPVARGDESADLVDKSLEAHAEITRLCDDMRMLDGDDPVFDAKLSLLREHVESHVKEEEFELFPECERYLSEDRLQELGQLMAEKFRTRVGDEKRFDVGGAELEEGEYAEEGGLEVEFELDIPNHPRA
jgi:hemerythrin-like domain-containing protein